MQKDPIGLSAGDTNLYRYVFNNPINYNDPTGEFVPAILIGFVALGIFEVSYDITTFVMEFYKTDFNSAKRAVGERSPLFGSGPSGQVMSVASTVTGPADPAIQALANPELLNAAIQLKDRQKKIDSSVKEQTGEGNCQ